ncbi:hypothetical protein BGW36DRAFT_48955 [Talaromyces proteolyticus]|uniref:Uncharacterized protein n=1 Tax=Talaromyces proteolyticus TaxID=1131652 RepID=A0AAD4PVD1_9EURO|nr:uncharacterized protein BGW36DRAFT_48955 [Talaromyces proteolyticus]KAH8691223.1 hypothetical protein BGW36DRAFT_48955 [Talaromyces proteolyticus]
MAKEDWPQARQKARRRWQKRNTEDEAITGAGRVCGSGGGSGLAAPARSGLGKEGNPSKAGNNIDQCECSPDPHKLALIAPSKQLISSLSGHRLRQAPVLVGACRWKMHLSGFWPGAIAQIKQKLTIAGKRAILGRQPAYHGCLPGLSLAVTSPILSYPTPSTIHLHPSVLRRTAATFFGCWHNFSLRVQSLLSIRHSLMPWNALPA